MAGRVKLMTVGVVGIAMAAGLPAGSAVAATGGVQVVPTPAQLRPAGFAAVSFDASGQGWAVGSIGEQFGVSGIDALIERWTGTSWSVVSTPAVRTSDERLTGVVALGASDAWAVGRQDRYGYNDATAILMRWDGTQWSRQRPPAAGIPTVVDGSSSTDVWAIGPGVFQHFDGATWSPAAVPDAAAVPTGVAVLSATDAWVVGFRPVDRPGYNHTAHPYVAHWDGVSWQTVMVPHPETDARFASVSGSSGSDLWAVGAAFDAATGEPGTYAQHYDGVRWRPVAVPDQGSFNALDSVVSVSADEAYAVGHRDGYNRQGGAVWKTLVERWDGQTWSILASPNDSQSDNYLDGVAAAGSVVWAVGSDGGTLVERVSTS